MEQRRQFANCSALSSEITLSRWTHSLHHIVYGCHIHTVIVFLPWESSNISWTELRNVSGICSIFKIFHCYRFLLPISSSYEALCKTEEWRDYSRHRCCCCWLYTSSRGWINHRDERNNKLLTHLEGEGCLLPRGIGTTQPRQLYVTKLSRDHPPKIQICTLPTF